MDQTTPTTPPSPLVYASSGKRLLASIIDSFILGVIAFAVMIPLSFVFVASSGEDVGALDSFVATVSNILFMLLAFGYLVYFTSKTGQTLGKKIAKIKVVTEENQQVPDLKTAIIRETIGRMVAGFLFSLGYLWILWDKKKQGWHDKLAGTVVVRAE